MTHRTARWLPRAVVGATTFVAFLPTLQNDFVRWDDFYNILTNPRYRGLGWAHLQWMFTDTTLNDYIPVTWMTLGADFLLWGLNPQGYHLTSLLIHVATTLLAYSVTVRLLRIAMRAASDTGLRLGAAVAALVFAVHPLRVEAVAWVSGRQHLVGGFFFLLAVLLYLRACAADGGGRRWWLAATLAAFIVGVLSKITVVALPLVLVALDFYPLGRARSPAAWLEKIPFAVVAAAGAVTMFMVRAGLVMPLEQQAVTARLAQSAFGLAFYAWKTVAPTGLSPLYPREALADPLGAAFVGSALVVAAITAVAVAGRQRFPAGLTAWSCYAVLLAPTLGLVPYGEQLVADRYSYLACLGWAVVAGGVMTLGWQRAGRRRAAVLLAAAAVVAALSGLTWRQTQVWHDTFSLWTHALAVDSRSYRAHFHLGEAFAAQGRYDAAVGHYRDALRDQPADPFTQNNLGAALANQGKYAEALPFFLRAIELRRHYAHAHLNLGLAYLMLDDRPAARQQYEVLKTMDARLSARLGSAIEAAR